jgi:hypothetical protein
MFKYTAYYVLPSFRVWKISSLISKVDFEKLDKHEIVCLIANGKVWYNDDLLRFLIMSRSGGEEVKSIIESIKKYEIVSDKL